MRISNLIKKLQHYQSDVGDLNVYLNDRLLEDAQIKVSEHKQIIQEKVYTTKDLTLESIKNNR